MKVRTTCKQVANLTEDEIRICKRTSYGYQGQLYYLIDDCHSEGVGIVARARDEHGELIGWGLLYPLNTTQYAIQLYVKRIYRRKGIGTRIVKALIKRNSSSSQCKVWGWDPRSIYFFNKIDQLDISLRG